MFKALNSVGADLSGTADNCAPIQRNDVQTAGDLLTFILPTEKPWIILKSKVKEFIFTDCAFIYIERDNAFGTKRKVARYDYFNNFLSNVIFETAGMTGTDLACEIKFRIGSTSVDIDIVKSETETAKLYYRALVALSVAQARDGLIYSNTLKMAQTLMLQDPSQLSHLSAFASKLVETSFPSSYNSIFESALGNHSH